MALGSASRAPATAVYSPSSFYQENGRSKVQPSASVGSISTRYRPILSPDERCDQEYCSLRSSPGCQSPSTAKKTPPSHSRTEQVTKRRMRTKFTPAQIESLEASFDEARYPSSSQRQHLAKKLGLSDLCVQVRKN